MSAKPTPLLQASPHDVNAERALLGSLMRDNSFIDEVAAIVRAENFYVFAHQKIFEAILELVRCAKPADPALIADVLNARNLIVDIGGYGYLVELWQSAPSIAHANHYAEIVREKAIVRQIIAVSQDVSNAAFQPGARADELLALAETKILAVGDTEAPAESVSLGQAINETLADLERRMECGAADGVKTPWPSVNEVVGEFRRGALSVLGARPAVGKTTLLLNIARHLIENDASVLFCSLEMTRRELSESLICMEAEFPKFVFRKADAGKIRSNQTRLLDASDRLKCGRLQIDDATGQTVFRIGAIARRMARRGKLDAILVDYLQLVEPSDPRARRHEQVDAVARELKKLAMSLNVPILAAAQLNREVEGRGDSRPRLSDLRESGGIEQHADLVVLLHAAEVDADNRDRPTEVIVRKNRHGPTGDTHLIFHRATGVFSEMQMPT